MTYRPRKVDDNHTELVRLWRDMGAVQRAAGVLIYKGEQE